MGLKYIHLLFPVVFSLLSTLPLFAQDEPRTLLSGGGENTWVSGFGGPMVEFTELAGGFTVGAGGGGAAIFNNRFYFGGFGMGFTNNNSDITNDQVTKVTLGYGGLWMGYLFNSENIFHAGFSTKFGWGGYTLNDFAPGQSPVLLFEEENVFVLYPQIEAELNVAYWFKLNFGIGYRWVSGVNSPNISTNDLSSPSGKITFIFGWFKPY